LATLFPIVNIILYPLVVRNSLQKVDNPVPGHKHLLYSYKPYSMPIPVKYQADFNAGSIYHVFNRTNNKELLFITDENRHYFLRKYRQYLSPFVETFSWCLLPNHFHLLLRVKPAEVITTYLKRKDPNECTLTERQFLNEKAGVGELIERAFKNMFQSYSLAFNKQHARKGNLFCKPFRRVEVNKESQFTQAIVYIHANPQKHSIVKDFREYKWSSYDILRAQAPTILLRQEVMEWFGSKELFEKTHIELAQYYYKSEVGIEE
jgi:putative transposase